MIKYFLKNIFLISFALVVPITLPVGGIQRNLNESKYSNNFNEIILNTSCPLYTFPKVNAKKLSIINPGSSLLILRKWKVNDNNVWFRVEIATNHLIEHPNKITKGWIKV